MLCYIILVGHKDISYVGHIEIQGMDKIQIERWAMSLSRA